MKIPRVLAPEFMKFGDMLDDDDDDDDQKTNMRNWERRKVKKRTKYITEFITAFTSALSWIRGLGISCQSKL